MVNRYEIIMIAPGDYKEDVAEDIFETYKRRICPAKIISAESWGNKKLAYPIGKQKTGWYYLFDFYAMPETLEKIEQYIKTDASIIKHLSVLKESGEKDELTEFESEDELTSPPEEESEQQQDLYSNIKSTKKPVDVFDLIFKTGGDN